MKLKNNLCRTAFLIITVVAVAFCSVLPVSAGVSMNEINSSSITEDLNNSSWSNPEGDVLSEDGKIVFPESSTEATRLISKDIARVDENLTNLASVKAKLEFLKMPSGQKFVVAFGLANIETMLSEAGNIEIAFFSNGNIVITSYDDAANEKAVTTKNIGSLKTAEIDANLNAKGEISLAVNGTSVCTNVPTGVSGNGKIGFLQSGGCRVAISNLNINTYMYERPENKDFSEDFETGSMDINVLHSYVTIKPTKPLGNSYIGVEDYKGSKVLRWRDVNAAYIGTKHEFSNFEMTFDVPYLARDNEYNENGELVTNKSAGFGVVYGSDAQKQEGWGYQNAYDMVIFRDNSKVESLANNKFGVIDEDYLFADSEKGKPFSVKISLIDSVVTVSLKWMEETEFKQVLSYQLGNKTQKGYIQIWTMGSGNMAIDNLKIVNKDINPNLIELDKRDGLVPDEADYVYEPFTSTYAKVAKEKSFNWYIIIPIVAAACTVCFIAVVVIKSAVSKKRKTNY